MLGFGIILGALSSAALLALPAQALQLGAQDNGRKILLRQDEAISIELPGNPTTGFIWEMTNIDRQKLTLQGEGTFAADSPLSGAGGSFTFRLMPRQPGQSRLKLVYHRPWEQSAPQAVFEVALSVDPAEANSVYRSTTGKEMAVIFDLNGKQATISLPDGRSVTLPLARSASGARYSDGRETFWEHQGVGRFFRGEKLIFEGQLRGK